MFRRRHCCPSKFMAVVAWFGYGLLWWGPSVSAQVAMSMGLRLGVIGSQLHRWLLSGPLPSWFTPYFLHSGWSSGDGGLKPWYGVPHHPPAGVVGLMSLTAVDLHVIGSDSCFGFDLASLLASCLVSHCLLVHFRALLWVLGEGGRVAVACKCADSCSGWRPCFSHVFCLWGEWPSSPVGQGQLVPCSGGP